VGSSFPYLERGFKRALAAKCEKHSSSRNERRSWKNNEAGTRDGLLGNPNWKT